ncbi:MAG TPA: glycerate kinase [Opitutaceae bacterium]|nr:glycerate kinase [Opitutaceae bacterium]
MRVLLAFDKFKDSMTAEAACEAAATAIHSADAATVLDACPLADGGEGFATILTQAAGGELRRLSVTGPVERKVAAAYGLVAGGHVPVAARAQLFADAAATAGPIAVIEMAAASGLALLAPGERDVWRTTTVGTGELIRAAADAGAEAIVLGVGGSATNDLGVGALSALGLQFLSAAGTPVMPPVPASWGQIARCAGALRSLPPIFIACDVSNPLLGPNGAAAVYGPQKGLQPEDGARMDHAGARMALLLCAQCGQPDTLMDVAGAGAAGGIAFGLMVAAGARLLPGFDFVSRWLDLDAKIAAADLVITGEGRFDDSSLSGKGPGAVAARALALGKPVHVFAGAVAATHVPAGLTLHAITPPGLPLAEALREAPANLGAAVRRLFQR